MRQGGRAARGLGDRAAPAARRSRGAALSGAALGERAAATLARLARRGFATVEVYEKRGRSRRYELGPEGESVFGAEEAGWAVRAGDLERSCFAAGSGALDPEVALPEPTAHPLRLPEARPLPPWSEPPGLDAPLLSETEAWTLLAAIEQAVAREIPGARLAAARLEDGASEGYLVSSRGIAAASRARAASLRLELEAGAGRCLLEVAERDPRAHSPLALARRAVDRLLARRAGAEPAEGDLVLAAPLAARLVEAMAPLFVGAEAAAPLATLCDAAGRIASPALTLVDDGRLPAGALAAAVDGEGLPTGERRLIEQGRFVGPLLAWWEARGEALPGCARRAGWRDLPRRAPTQMLIAPDGALAPAELVGGVARGAYLIDAEGGVRWERGALRFRVPVSGFALAGGRAVAPLGACWLEGDLRALLAGVVAAARDLAFTSGDGLYGAPTLLVRGLRLLAARA